MQSSFKPSLSTILLTCFMPLATSQNVPPANTANDPIPSPAAQRFVCNVGYTQQQCHEQMSHLKSVLDKYGAGRLGEWTWVLVKSQDWQQVGRNRLNPDSPAFTVLDRRETFFEEALVGPVTVRRPELVRQWSLSTDDLLNLAVTHELGHAFCNERDEKKADAYGELMRKGQSIRCK